MDISCGAAYGIALTNDGKVYQWGTRYPNKTGMYQPELVEHLENEKIVKVFSGSTHSVVVSDKNEVWVWGTNSHGMLCTPDVNGTTVPLKLKLPFTVQEVFIGDDNTWFLSSENDLYACGNNLNGQVKNNLVFLM